MGLGKTVQLLALESVRARTASRTPGPTLLLCPMSLVGNWQREAARFAPELRVLRPPRPGRARAATRCATRARATPTWSSPPTPPPPATSTSWPRSTGTGSCSTRRRPSRTACRAAARGGAPAPAPAPGRAHRHPGGEPARRAVVDHGRPQPRPARHRRAVPRPATRSRSSGTAATEPADAAARDHPALHAAPAQDRPDDHRRPAREDRDHAVLPAHPRAGLALPAVVDDMLEKIEDAEGIAAARQRARRDDQAQAGLQPPRPAAARRLAGRPALRQGRSGSRRSSTRSSPRATGCCASPSSPSSRDLLRAAPGRPVRHRRRLPARRHPEEAPRRDGGAVPGRATGPPIFLLSLKAGGTGLNLTAANHVVHLDRWWNPAVENQATDRAFRIGQRRNVQVRKFVCTGTARGADRRDDRGRRRRWPSWSSATARAGSPSCPPATCASVFALSTTEAVGE